MREGGDGDLTDFLLPKEEGGGGGSLNFSSLMLCTICKQIKRYVSFLSSVSTTTQFDYFHTNTSQLSKDYIAACLVRLNIQYGCRRHKVWKRIFGDHSLSY